MNTQQFYGKPRDKSMDSARHLKAQQRTTAEEWESLRGSPAPLWMLATVEDIARHIDMVHDAAKDHGVQLKWQQIEYGLTWEQICEIAKAKQSYKYTVGDYLPREAKRVIAQHGDGDKYEIRDYFSVFYITRNDCVCGLYKDGGAVKATTNSLTRENIFAVRFASSGDAKNALDSIKF
jgi:hypothetical protein